MIQKIISGGQIGADQAGWIAAKKQGIKTGGYMPKGFKTKGIKTPYAYHPEFAELYGAVEHHLDTYPPRTALNVKESCGTVRFATDFNTPGEVLTHNCILQYNKPYFDVHILGQTSPIGLAKWITDNNIQILNVAGNADKRIEEFVVGFLMNTFDLLEQ
jgi:hypothetical protein